MGGIFENTTILIHLGSFRKGGTPQIFDMSKLIKTPVPESTSPEEIKEVNEFLSSSGLHLYFSDESQLWVLTGFPKMVLTDFPEMSSVRRAILEFEAGYDFEKWLQKQDVLRKGDEGEWYEFDSEYSQVWIYFGDADFAYSIMKELERKVRQIKNLFTF